MRKTKAELLAIIANLKAQLQDSEDEKHEYLEYINELQTAVDSFTTPTTFSLSRSSLSKEFMNAAYLVKSSKEEMLSLFADMQRAYLFDLDYVPSEENVVRTKDNLIFIQRFLEAL